MRSIPTLVTVFAVGLYFPLPISFQRSVAAWEKEPLSASSPRAAQESSEGRGMGMGRLQPPRSAEEVMLRQSCRSCPYPRWGALLPARSSLLARPSPRLIGDSHIPWTA